MKITTTYIHRYGFCIVCCLFQVSGFDQKKTNSTIMRVFKNVAIAQSLFSHLSRQYIRIDSERVRVHTLQRTTHLMMTTNCMTVWSMDYVDSVFNCIFINEITHETTQNKWTSRTETTTKITWLSTEVLMNMYD